MKCVTLVAIAITTLSACAGGTEKTIVAPPPPPPVTTFTATIEQVNTSITRATFPNSLLSLKGTVRTNLGVVVSSGFSWTLNGESVSSASTFEQTVTPGTYTVCLEAPASKACNTVSVSAPKPMTGSVFLATVSEIPTQNPQLVACSWKSGETGCVDMNADMQYSIASADFLSDTSYIFIRCKTAGCGWKSSITQVSRVDSAKAINVVLLRDSWKIQCGTWANTTITLSLEKAYSFRENNGIAMNIPFFFRSNNVPLGYIYNSPTWNKNSFPIPVALDSDSSDVALLPNDSTIVMNSAQSLSENFGSQCFLGKPLFRPATFSEVGPVNQSGRRSYLTGIGIQVKNIPNSLAGGSGDGTNIVGGSIFLSQNPQSLFLAIYVIKHELVHTLGFGHGNGRVAWQPGLMTDSTNLRTSDPLTGVLIAEEVAHMQAFYRVRELALKYNACGIGCIHQGERINLGLPVQRVYAGSLSAPTQFSGNISRNETALKP